MGPLTTSSLLRATFPTGGTGRSSGRLLEEPEHPVDESAEEEVQLAFLAPGSDGLVPRVSGSGGLISSM